MAKPLSPKRRRRPATKHAYMCRRDGTEIRNLEHVIRLALQLEEFIMAVDAKIAAAQTRLDAAVAQLRSDVDALKAASSGNAADVDAIAAGLNATADNVEALDASIKPA